MLVVKTRAAAHAGAPRAKVGGGPAARDERPAPLASRLFDVADAGRIIGRQAEVARLCSLWQAAAAGAARVALVAGDAGVGKTRLVVELAETVEAAGGRVLAGRCRPGGDRPYEPFLQALGPELAARPDTWLRAHVKRHGSALLRLFPELSVRLADPSLDSQVGARPQLLAAMPAAIAGPAKTPVLLVVEDLQWAGSSTIHVLEHLARNRPHTPLLAVGTYRAASVHPSHPLAELLFGAAARNLDQLVLANLTPAAVATLLVDRAAVAGRAASTLARTLWLRTEGNPLLLTEVLRDMVARGGLKDAKVDVAAIERSGVPHEVAELVSRRLGRPSAAARKAVEIGAVIGRPFSAAQVAAIGETKEDAAASALAKAAAAGVVAALPDRPGHYGFVHELMREAVYEWLPPNRRVRLHHDVAQLLEQPDQPAPVPAAVLVHQMAAASPVGQAPAASSAAERAGRAAMDVLAYEEAAAFFGQALAFLGSGAEPGRRADLLMLLADAHHRSGESARARQSYLQAGAVARAHKDGPRLGRAVLGLGEVLDVWGADGVLIGLLDEAIAACPDEASLKAKLVARLAQARAAFDSPDKRKAQSDEAWELAWDSRDPDTMGAVLRARHEALSAPDDLEDRVEMEGELFAMATNAKDADLALLAHGWRLVDLLEQSHLVDAERDRKAHAQLARRSGDDRHQRDAAMWAATWALIAGRPGKATGQIDRALTLGQASGDHRASAIYWEQQLGLLLEWGSDAELEGLIEVWRDLIRSHDGSPAWRSSLALLLARSGREDEAGTVLDELLAEDCGDLPQDRAWLPSMAAIGEVAALLGDPRSEEIGKLLWPYGRRLIVHANAAACRGPLARVLGLLAAASDSWPAAERHFQSALTTAERIDAGPFVARARSEFGQALAAKPGGPLQAGRARATLAQALEEATLLGMERLAADTRAALSRLPARRSG